MTIAEIRALTPKQVRDLSDQELRRLTQQMADAANKRARNLMESDIGRESKFAKRAAAAEAAGKPLYSLADVKERNQVKAMFDDLRTTLSPTNRITSVKGLKRLKREQEKRLGASLTTEQWKAFHRLSEYYGGQFPTSKTAAGGNARGSKEVIQRISRIRSNNKSYITKKLKKELGSEYEKQEEQNRSNEGIFFGKKNEF